LPAALFTERLNSGGKMNKIHRLGFALGAVLLSAGMAAAQTTSKSTETGTAQFTVAQVTGEVVMVDGNYLLVKMRPSGVQRWFSVNNDRQFIIDGQAKTISQLTPGTVLTATAVTKTLPVTVRTTTITNGTVLNVSGRNVSVRLENGERRSYTVPDSFRFNVDGKQITVSQLQKGMHVTATRIVSEPESEISTLAVVTGKAPK
jgi:RNase P/RNase MRP subunit p29